MDFLRHTFASWLVQAGVPLLEVKVAMRHAGFEQTEKYAHLSTDIASRVVEVLETCESGDNLSHYLSHPDFWQEYRSQKCELYQEVIGRDGRI